MSEVLLCDGSVRSLLIGSSQDFVSECEANNVLARAVARASLIDCGAIQDPSINYDLAREVIRSSGHFPTLPRLLLSARVSLYDEDNTLIPFEDEVAPILKIARDLRNNHYSDVRIMGAVYAGTDPVYMASRGDTWEGLNHRVSCALSALKSEGIPRILVTQSIQAIKDTPVGIANLCRVAREEGVEQIWLADTRPGENVGIAVQDLWEITKGNVKVGFMGTGDNATINTRNAVMYGAEVIYGVENAPNSPRNLLKFPQINDLRRLF